MQRGPLTSVLSLQAWNSEEYSNTVTLRYVLCSVGLSVLSLSPSVGRVGQRGVQQPWMKEVKGIRHRGEGAYLRYPVFTTVQFSLRDEGSSEYICVCEGRESLRPNFKLFRTPAIDSTELIP